MKLPDGQDTVQLFLFCTTLLQYRLTRIPSIETLYGSYTLPVSKRPETSLIRSHSIPDGGDHREFVGITNKVSFDFRPSVVILSHPTPKKNFKSGPTGPETPITPSDCTLKSDSLRRRKVPRSLPSKSYSLLFKLRRFPENSTEPSSSSSTSLPHSINVL